MHKKVCKATPLAKPKGGGHIHVCEVWLVCLFVAAIRKTENLQHLKIRRGNELQSCAVVCRIRLAELCFYCMAML